MTAHQKYQQLVPRPAAAAVNGRLSPLNNARPLAVFGEPAETKSARCAAVTSDRLRPMLVTASVGPFRVTGHRMAVASLREVMADVKRRLPDLYPLLGSAGMLCARLVRGSDTAWSNHSWGFAVDLTVGGKLDARGDGMVQAGLLAVYGSFHRHGWYWGSEFRVEDAMHFEVASETFDRWKAKSLL